MNQKKWHVDYVVGNTYKCKIVVAENAEKAIKKAKVKNIVDLSELKAKKEESN